MSMDVRGALKGQYHAAFLMLADCVQACPDDLWLAGKPPRPFWRIAYHAAFFGHLYMGQNEAEFKPWEKNRKDMDSLWDPLPTGEQPYTKTDVLAYIELIRNLTDPTIDALDLDTSDSGFPWYPNITKLEHEILSIRHVQGHVGQLSELLMAAGIDTKWISRRTG